MLSVVRCIAQRLLGVHIHTAAVLQSLSASHGLSSGGEHDQKAKQRGTFTIICCRMHGVSLSASRVTNPKFKQYSSRRQLEELRKSNMTMEEELARRAAAAESGAQLVADQHRFSEEKSKVGKGKALIGVRAAFVGRGGPAYEACW